MGYKFYKNINFSRRLEISSRTVRCSKPALNGGQYDAEDKFFFRNNKYAFTLIEMLVVFLVISILLAITAPTITKRTKADFNLTQRVNKLEDDIEELKSNAIPIGTIAIWSTSTVPTGWLICNGQVIPAGDDYAEIRAMYGSNVPDFRGMFLRGYGSQAFSQNNGSTVGTTSTTYASGALNAIQGESIREISGGFSVLSQAGGYAQLVGDAWGPFLGWRDQYNPYFPTSVTYATESYRFNKIRFYSSQITPTSNEIRPVNKAVNFIIKAKE